MFALQQTAQGQAGHSWTAAGTGAGPVVHLEAAGGHAVVLGDVRPAPHQKHPRLALLPAEIISSSEADTGCHQVCVCPYILGAEFSGPSPTLSVQAREVLSAKLMQARLFRDMNRAFDYIFIHSRGRKCPHPHRVLHVVAERRHQQRQPLPVGHGVEGPAEQADGVDGLGHVGHVGPAVVGVGGHVAADCADKVADGAPAD